MPTPLFMLFWDVGWGLHFKVCADNENIRNLETIRKINAKEGVLWNGCRESHTIKHSTSSRGTEISGNLKCLPRKSELLLPVFCSRKPVASVSGGNKNNGDTLVMKPSPYFLQLNQLYCSKEKQETHLGIVMDSTFVTADYELPLP